MAKKDKNSCDFNAELKKLKAGSPDRLYLLYGNEDYLRDYFLTQLRENAFPAVMTVSVINDLTALPSMPGSLQGRLMSCPFFQSEPSSS